MAENSWPFEDQSTTETQFTKWASTLVNSGVISGLAVSVSSGMGLSVGVGSAIVRGLFYENTEAKALVVEAANTSTRKDAIVLQLDLATNAIVAMVKKGTTTSGGTLPPLTQTLATWELLIAEITVPGNATNLVAGNISARRSSPGLRVIDYVAAERPASPDSSPTIGLDKTNRRLELWSGGSWYSLTPELTWGGIAGKPATYPPTIGSGAGDAVAGNDPRLSDARTPTAHEHDDRYYTKAQSNALLGGRNYTASSSAPSSPVSGDLWDELT